MASLEDTNILYRTDRRIAAIIDELSEFRVVSSAVGAHDDALKLVFSLRTLASINGERKYVGVNIACHAEEAVSRRTKTAAWIIEQARRCRDDFIESAGAA